MNIDEPVNPITPVQPVAPVNKINLRRRPSFGQLKTWLAFAQRKGKQRRASNASTDPSDT